MVLLKLRSKEPYTKSLFSMTAKVGNLLMWWVAGWPVDWFAHSPEGIVLFELSLKNRVIPDYQAIGIGKPNSL